MATGNSLFEDKPAAASPSPDDAPVRVCRRCSAQAATASLNCPHCGASYVRGWKGRKRRTKVAFILVPLVVLLSAGATGLAIKHQHDQDAKHKRLVAQQRADAHRRAQAAAARAKVAAQREQDALDQIKIDERKSIETDLRRAVTKDAVEKSNEGLLSASGPITHTRCNPIAGGSNSLSEPTARYDCMAVDQTDADGTERGFEYTGTINFDKGSYTWQLQP